METLVNFSIALQNILFGSSIEYHKDSEESPAITKTEKMITDIFTDTCKHETISNTDEDIAFYNLTKDNILTILKYKTYGISMLPAEMPYGELPFEFMRFKNLVNELFVMFAKDDVENKLSSFLKNIKLVHVLNHRGPFEIKELGSKSDRCSLSSRCERLINRINKKDIITLEYIVKWFGDVDLYKCILLLSMNNYIPNLKTKEEYKLPTSCSSNLNINICKKDEILPDSETSSKLETIIQNFIDSSDSEKSIVKLLSMIKIGDLLKFNNRYHVNQEDIGDDDLDDLATRVATDITTLRVMKHNNQRITVKYLVKIFGKYDLLTILAILCHVFVIEM